MDIDVKHLRWVSWILADGSQIRSLSGRSAQLGDGYSRNPKDRDAIIEQRTKDLQGRTGQLRGFSMDEFLSDHAEGGRPLPWTVGDGAVRMVTPECPAPRPVLAPSRPGFGADETWTSPWRTTTGAHDAGVVAQLMAESGVKKTLKVVLAADYVRPRDVEDMRIKWKKMFSLVLPAYHMSVSVSTGPFEDADGSHSHFDGKKAGISEHKLVLETRKDALLQLHS